jgi:catechol 2,3-dioxygenase-like lactoylglutathione lyase family enzyme
MDMRNGPISRLQLVMIPVTDQDRSIGFYASLGFSPRVDIPWRDGHRWVELYPPDGTAGITLLPAGPENPSPASTGIILNTGDIESTHALLQSSGVDIDAAVARVGSTAEIRLGAVALSGPVPPMFWLRDPDGNTLLIVEAT